MAQRSRGKPAAIKGFGLGLLCLLSAATFASAAPPADWTGVLRPPAGGDRLPTEAVVLDLPPDIDPSVPPSLVLEVDGIDVTAMVTFDALSLAFVPVGPLAPGIHPVRLAQLAEDGGLTERGSFDVWISGSAPPPPIPFSNEASINAVWRATQSDLPEGTVPEDPWLVTLSDRLTAEPGKGGAVSGTVGAEVLAYSNDSLSGTGTDYADFGQHLVTARGGPLSLSAGLHTPGPEGIVLQGLSRRGISGDLTLAGGSIGATAFMMRVTPSSGLEDFVGMDDPRNRVSGTIVSLRPWRNHPGRLALSATLLAGEGPEGFGASVIGDSSVAEGRAWGVSAEGGAMGDRFRFRGEYARSRYDFDPGEAASGEQDGDAWGARLAWSAIRPAAESTIPYGIDLEGEYRHVGTFFRSIGNPGLPADRRSLRGAARATWSWIALDGVFERTEDNADGLATVPRLRSTVGTVGLTLGPLAAPRLAAVVGPASLALTLRSAGDRTADLPANYEGPLTDRDVTDIGIMLSSSLARWGWGIGWSEGREVDRTGAALEVDRTQAQASLFLRPADWLELGLAGQWNASADAFAAVTRDTFVSTLSTTVLLIPDALTLTGSWQHYLEGASDDSTDAVTSQLEAEIAWLYSPGGGWPSVRTSVKGQFRDRDDRLDDLLDESFYQAFLGIAASWPTSMAGTGGGTR